MFIPVAWKFIVKTVAWVGAAMVVIVVLHLGGLVALRVGEFSPLTGAFIGGTLVLSGTLLPRQGGENTEPWIGYEQVGWALIGFGAIRWGIGDCFWRYYVSIGQAPFPSTADIGYSGFPILVFLGLLGLMTIGCASYLRRFLPATPAEVIEQRMEDYEERHTFGVTRFIPYILLGLLFIALALNVLSSDPGQLAIRPVLLFATMGVVALVVMCQLFTLWENARLAGQQAEALADLERANTRIEDQARQIADHNVELERGIVQLKNVQAQLANGNLRARANLTSGALLPLAGSLNLMAERLMRLGQTSVSMQRLMRALGELSIAFERRAAGAPFIVPESCNEFIEINRLLTSMHLKATPVTSPITPPCRTGIQRSRKPPCNTQKRNLPQTIRPDIGRISPGRDCCRTKSNERMNR